MRNVLRSVVPVELVELVELVALVSIVSIVSIAALPLAAQAPKKTSKTSYKAPRTAWGDPDLQGVWPGTDYVGVPLQRPASFGERNLLTVEEFKTLM